MTEAVHPAIVAYSRGEISANRAADRLGPGATVADVFVQTLAAGLGLPLQTPEQERAELLLAMKVLGWA